LPRWIAFQDNIHLRSSSVPNDEFSKTLDDQRNGECVVAVAFRNS